MPSLAYPHEGRLDSNGGHFNRKTGNYHCHRCSCDCSFEQSKNYSPYTPMRDRPKTQAISSNIKTKFPIESDETILCTRVIDGDTIEISYFGKKEKVRLIGVDTPETMHPQKPIEYFGKEASAFTKKMVEGKKIKLEFGQNRRDKYKRLLAYVFLKDGTFVNSEIIKQGYGHAYTKFPFRYMNEFRQYEREARIRKRGLWK